MRPFIQFASPLVAALLLLPTGTRGQQGKDAVAGKQGAIRVVNEKGKATTLTAEQLAKMPRLKVTAKDRDDKDATFEGVAVVELLKAGEVALGKQLRGPLVANCLVVFSLPEVDPALTDNVVILADRKDGKMLDDKEGPFRIVVPRDKLHMRWVRQVTGLSVQAVQGTSTGSKDGK
jgi:hypothetical protein